MKCVSFKIVLTTVQSNMLSAKMFTLILVLALVVTAWTAPNNCSTQYQAALQQVLDIKETCSEAVYKDCCEVSKKLDPHHLTCSCTLA